MGKIVLACLFVLSLLSLGKNDSKLADSSLNSDDCKGHFRICRHFDGDYKYSAQSRLAKINKDTSVEFHVVLFGNAEYQFSVCLPQHDNAYIIIKDDNAAKKVLYDSSKSNKSQLDKQLLVLSTIYTRNVIVEVVIPENEEDKIFDRNKSKCIGLIVEYAKMHM